MKRHYGFDSKYYKCMGFCTVCLMVIGLVFYTIFVVRTFNNGTDWLVGTLLIFGEVAMITLLPAIANTFIEWFRRFSAFLICPTVIPV